MKEAILGINPEDVSYCRVSTDWTDIQILTDPFVIYTKRGYSPVLLVEELNTEEKCLLFVSAKSLSEFLEKLRKERGALVGVNVRVRKRGEEKFSTYEVEELAE